MAQILAIADPERLPSIAQALRADGHIVHTDVPGTADVDVVIGPADSLALAPPAAIRLLVSDSRPAEAARETAEHQAYDWVEPSADPVRLAFVVRQALAARANVREVARLRELTAADDIAGISPLAAELRRATQRAAAADGPVLLSGPGGASLERIARLIHAWSDRRGAPFVSLACSALPPAFAEAELRGRIQSAESGTLFLDEIGSLTLPAQAHVLGALDSGVRVIASTGRDLPSLVTADRFRPDLAARLGERTIVVPSLRARLEDLPALVERHLATHRRGSRGDTPAVSEEALARLAEHDWPGDVRELETVLERALALARGPVLGAADLPFGERPTDEAELPADRSFFKTSVAAFERDLIMTALRDAGGNRSRAAELLGIYRRLLYAKIKEYGLEGYPRKSS